jgi:beta-lactamase class C
MRPFSVSNLGILAIIPLLFGTSAQASEERGPPRLKRIVDEVIGPLMKENGVPGMAVAVTVQGKRHFFNYGVASKETGQQVTENTIFEIGSISKTFTAILASYAQERGTLSLTDKASQHLPQLAGSSFDRISLLDLGTYTAGGLPLQFPAGVSADTMTAYYRSWQPAYDSGTYRLYSNPSIGLLGYLTAKSLGRPFDEVMEQTFFPAFGLTRTYINVPLDRMGSYASGYSKANKPVRVTRGALASEAYGVKTTSSDLIRFVEANMNGAALTEPFRRAIATTHTGYYKIDDMIQGLGWEMYASPTDLDRLLAGNSSQMAIKAHKASKFNPPLPPQEWVLINKTGSTNGFGAYAAFIPAKDIGVVMLANRNYPVPARVKAAYRILMALDGLSGTADAD